MFQRRGRAWLTLGMDLKTVSPVEPWQPDEVMGLRKLDGAHQRIVSLSTEQRPEHWLECLPVEARATLLSWTKDDVGTPARPPDSGQVAFAVPLRGGHAAATGGLRQCAGAVDRLAQARSANRVLRTMVDCFLDAFPRCRRRVRGCDWQQQARRRTQPRASHRVSDVFAKAVGPRSCVKDCDVQGSLLEAWARHCGDPDI